MHIRIPSTCMSYHTSSSSLFCSFASSRLHAVAFVSPHTHCSNNAFQFTSDDDDAQNTIREGSGLKQAGKHRTIRI